MSVSLGSKHTSAEKGTVTQSGQAVINQQRGTVQQSLTVKSRFFLLSSLLAASSNFGEYCRMPPKQTDF